MQPSTAENAVDKIIYIPAVFLPFFLDQKGVGPEGSHHKQNFFKKGNQWFFRTPYAPGAKK